MGLFKNIRARIDARKEVRLEKQKTQQMAIQAGMNPFEARANAIAGISNTIGGIAQSVIGAKANALAGAAKGEQREAEATPPADNKQTAGGCAGPAAAILIIGCGIAASVGAMVAQIL